MHSAAVPHGAKFGVQALEANGVQLTRATPAAAAEPGSRAKKQRSTAAVSSVDPRVRQQLWKLARPSHATKAAVSQPARSAPSRGGSALDDSESPTSHAAGQ